MTRPVGLLKNRSLAIAFLGAAFPIEPASPEAHNETAMDMTDAIARLSPSLRVAGEN
jgi:hypothetical protein